MSREIRRVPVGWQHPTEPNPYWREQQAARLRRGDPEPRLHASEVQFRSLHGRDILAYYEPGEDLPDEADLMPDFGPDQQELGWCLYQTVSEGTPITPVFSTADDLIEHLSAHGDDWTQEPWRRAAAEAIVRTGSSFGSFVHVPGEGLLDGARDLDRLQGNSETVHRMLPGSHESPRGPECRCGAAWDRWNDRCTASSQSGESGAVCACHNTRGCSLEGCSRDCDHLTDCVYGEVRDA
jgi:hypothetical protein